MRKYVVFWLGVSIALSIVVVSCSDNDNPLGSRQAGSYPYMVGAHWTYERIRHMELNDPPDTIDVRAIANTMVFDSVPAVIWEFDYNGRFDTLYVIVGDDTVQTYIGLVPPPDTCTVFRENGRLIMLEKPYQSCLFDFTHLALPDPSQVGNTWAWGPIMPSAHSSLPGYQRTETWATTVDNDTTITVPAGQYSGASRIEIESIDVAPNGSNKIYVNCWVVPGVGLIKSFEEAVDEGYDFGGFYSDPKSMITWQLLEYTPPPR